jgi:hypothetical protein
MEKCHGLPKSRYQSNIKADLTEKGYANRCLEGAVGIPMNDVEPPGTSTRVT